MDLAAKQQITFDVENYFFVKLFATFIFFVELFATFIFFVRLFAAFEYLTLTLVFSLYTARTWIA